MDRFLKFFQLTKVDEAERMVYGLVTAERVDKDGEICHYESTVPQYKAVNDEMGKATDGANIMPLREMHQLNAIGAGKSIQFDDSKKEIRMAFKVVDDSAWKKVMEKVLTGFSQGGRYLKRWTEGGKNYYTAEPGEVSLVDNPCLAGAVIEYAKADGSVEKYVTPSIANLSESDVERIVKAIKEGVLAKEVKYLVPDGKHLPYTGPDGKPDHRLMGAAWAALHGGYRGNKYEGADKEKAIAHLKEIYHSEGMEPPSSKAFLASLGLADSDLDTALSKFDSFVESLMGQQSPAKGGNMNKEQIAKCAAALGITVEEFTKQYVEGDALEKGKKGLAALHAHLKKAVAHHEKMAAHHEKMAEMHKAHGEMHDQHAEHLEDCVKAMGACMDGEEAEKVLKALGIELKAEAKPNAESMMKAEDVQKLIDESLKKQKEEFDKILEKTVVQPGTNGGAHLALIDRDGKVVKKVATAAEATNPLAIS